MGCAAVAGPTGQERIERTVGALCESTGTRFSRAEHARPDAAPVGRSEQSALNKSSEDRGLRSGQQRDVRVSATRTIHSIVERFPVVPAVKGTKQSVVTSERAPRRSNRQVLDQIVWLCVVRSPLQRQLLPSPGGRRPAEEPPVSTGQEATVPVDEQSVHATVRKSRGRGLGGRFMGDGGRFVGWGGGLSVFRRAPCQEKSGRAHSEDDQTACRTAKGSEGMSRRAT